MLSAVGWIARLGPPRTQALGSLLATVLGILRLLQGYVPVCTLRGRGPGLCPEVARLCPGLYLQPSGSSHPSCPGQAEWRPEKAALSMPAVWK